MCFTSSLFYRSKCYPGIPNVVDLKKKMLKFYKDCPKAWGELLTLKGFTKPAAASSRRSHAGIAIKSLWLQQSLILMNKYASPCLLRARAEFFEHQYHNQLHYYTSLHIITVVIFYYTMLLHASILYYTFENHTITQFITHESVFITRE